MKKHYVISFISKYFCPEIYEYQNIIESVIVELINEYETVTFLVARDSDLDRVVSYTINKLKRIYSSQEFTHFVQLSCSENDFFKREDEYMSYFDDKIFADYNCKLEYGDIFVIYKPDEKLPQNKLIIDLEKLI